MGKQTLYHPVSLAIVRGAAEYGGFKLGRMRQTWFDKSRGEASYATTLESIPQDCVDAPLHAIRKALSGLFASDVDVISVYQNRVGRMFVQIFCHTNVKPFQDERRYEDLTDAEKAELPF